MPNPDQTVSTCSHSRMSLPVLHWSYYQPPKCPAIADVVNPFNFIWIKFILRFGVKQVDKDQISINCEEIHFNKADISSVSPFVRTLMSTITRNSTFNVLSSLSLANSWPLSIWYQILGDHQALSVINCPYQWSVVPTTDQLPLTLINCLEHWSVVPNNDQLSLALIRCP